MVFDENIRAAASRFLSINAGRLAGLSSPRRRRKLPEISRAPAA
jgi:hypothetical protein